MELRNLYAALLRRKWLVLQAVVVFLFAATIMSFVLPKRYVAAARVLVGSSDTSASILSELGLGEMAAGMTTATDDIQNKIALSTTRPVMEEVIWLLQLRDDQGALVEAHQLVVPGLLAPITGQPQIAVVQQQGTDLLIFEATAGDPETARLLADTVVHVAVRRAQDQAQAESRNARVFIEDQLQVVKAEFDLALQSIADAQAQQEVIDLETEMKAAINRLSTLMLSLEENAAEAQELRARLLEARTFINRESLAEISPTTASQNAEVRTLQAQLTTLHQERVTELLSKTDQHPDITRIDALIAQVEGDLTKALDVQHALHPSVQELEERVAGLDEKGVEISEAIRRTTDAFASYPDKMRQLTQLELAAVAAENVYTSLQQQRYEIAVAEQMTLSDLELVEAAMAPERHSSPKLFLNIAAGLVVGLMFGLSLVFVFEYVDDSVKTPEDLGETWAVPRLGVIPKFKTRSDARTIEALTLTDPVSEAYRTVRNGLVYASLDKPLQVIAVSSSMPAEGKSTFTTNLAISFAREGKRVAIVDCDLRRPTQHRAFSTISNHRGLTNVLIGEADLGEALQASPVEGLQVLTSGPTPDDPARLVESLRLRQVLLDLQKSFDIVVVDTPPLLVVNDAMVIGRVVDGMVMVVESAKTTRKMLQDVATRFEDGGVEPVGLVLNKMRLTASGYGHYVKAYQAYQQAQDEAKDGVA